MVCLLINAVTGNSQDSLSRIELLDVSGSGFPEVELNVQGFDSIGRTLPLTSDDFDIYENGQRVNNAVQTSAGESAPTDYYFLVDRGGASDYAEYALKAGDESAIRRIESSTF